MTSCSCHCHNNNACKCIESTKMSKKDKLTHAIYFALHLIQMILIIGLVK